MLAGIAVLVMCGTAAPVAAECDGPWPSLERTAATARRIVIGDVVAIRPGGAGDVPQNGLSSRFSVRVDAVLRGGPTLRVDIDDLPSQPCASPLVARIGDRVLLALDGRDFVPPVTANIIAWIDQPPPVEAGFDPDVFTLTTEEAFALAGRPLPEPVETADGSTDDQPLAGVLAAAAVALGIVSIVALRRRRGLDAGRR